MSFSVVIPVYNGQAYLAATLDSVLAQTHPALEIVVVDDGSTDATAQVAEAYRGRIRYYARANAGVAEARNFGVAQTSAPWVALLDHDDLWEPGHLANLAEAIGSEDHADVCYSDRRFLREDAATGQFSVTPAQRTPEAAEMPRTLMERCPIVPSSVAIRREVYDAVGGFDSRFPPIEDWHLWLKLVHLGARWRFANRPTLLYRVHAASATNNPLRALAQSHKVVHEAILPHLSWRARRTRGRRILSRLEAEAAILLRENGQPAALGMMLRSIARHPFHAAERYKISAHMTLYRRRQANARNREAGGERVE